MPPRHRIRRGPLRLHPNGVPPDVASPPALTALAGEEDGVGGNEVLQLARGGGLNLVSALFSQAALFLVILLLGRWLGRSAVGVYGQALAFFSLLGLVSLSGFRAGLTRFVALHRADGDLGALRGTIRVGVGLSSLSAVVFGVLLFLLAPWLAGVFDDPRLQEPLRFIAVALPASAFTDAALSVTQGFKTMRYFAGIGLLVEPGIRIALTAALAGIGLGLRGAMIALLVSNVVAAVLAGRALLKLVGRRTERPRYNMRELFSFSAVSWMASLAATGLIWADTLILGIYRPSSDVGVYQVATRLVLLATLAMSPINSAFAPRIADLYRRQDFESLRRCYTAATGWIFRISLPAFVVLVVFPHEMLHLFGRGFEVGAAVTVVLAVGKLTDAATGPCGLMLNMSGRVALNMADNVAVLVSNVMLNIYLIPRHGIVGAAVAWTVSLVLVNLLRVRQVRKAMGMFPFDRGAAKGAAAAVLAAVAGIVVSAAVDGIPVPAGIGAIVVVYLGVLLVLRLPTDDWLVLRSVVRNR